MLFLSSDIPFPLVFLCGFFPFPGQIPLGSVLDHLLCSQYTLHTHGFKHGPYVNGISVKLWHSSASWAQLLYISSHTLSFTCCAFITEYAPVPQTFALILYSPPHGMPTSSTPLFEKEIWESMSFPVIFPLQIHHLFLKCFVNLATLLHSCWHGNKVQSPVCHHSLSLTSPIPLFHTISHSPH